MAAQRATNTQEEVLRKLLNQLNDAELAEDADPGYLAIVRSIIKAKLRAPIDNAAAQTGMSPDATAGLPAGAVGGDPMAAMMGGGGMGGAMGAPPGMPPGAQLGAAPMATPGGVPGVNSGLNRTAINPDELQRMLAGPG